MSDDTTALIGGPPPGIRDAMLRASWVPVTGPGVVYGALWKLPGTDHVCGWEEAVALSVQGLPQQTSFFKSGTFYLVVGVLVSNWDLAKELLMGYANVLGPPWDKLLGMTVTAAGTLGILVWREYRKNEAQQITNVRPTK